MRLEGILRELCRAAREALDEPGRMVEIPGFPGYGFEWIEVDGQLLPGLHIPPSEDKPDGSFDTGYGARIAEMCGLGYVIRSSCVIDEATVVHMHELYKRGWFVKIWKPGTECWAELITALEEGESN